MASRFCMIISSWCLIAALSAVGCGTGAADSRERFEVTGLVRLDGTPLDGGDIVFFPEKNESGGVVSGTSIRSGKFILPAAQGLPAGKYRVSITSVVVTGSTSSNPDDLAENPPEAKSLIPKQYNTETTLSSEIVAEVDNFFIFDLWTK